MLSLATNAEVDRYAPPPIRSQDRGRAPGRNNRRGGAAPAGPSASGPLGPLTLVTSTTKRCYLIADLGVTTNVGVNVWSDQSGNGFHFTQTIDSSAEPAFTQNDSTLNHRGSITGDGSNDYLTNATLTYAAGYWTMMIFKQITWTSTDSLMGAGTTVADRMCIRQRTASPQIGMVGSTTAGNNVSATIGTWYRLECAFTGTADYLHIGGTTANGTANVGTTASTGRTIFAGQTNSLFSNVAIALFFACTSKPTATELSAIDTWVTTYYGGTVTVG